MGCFFLPLRDMLKESLRLPASILCRHYCVRQLNAMSGEAIPRSISGHGYSLYKYMNQRLGHGSGIHGLLLSQKYSRFYSTVLFRSSIFNKEFRNEGSPCRCLNLGDLVYRRRVPGFCRMYSDPEISESRQIHNKEGLLSLSELVPEDSVSGNSIQKLHAKACPQPKFIHPTAIVHPDAIIGEGAIIGPFCTVGPVAKLGNCCQLHPGSHISGNTELGEGCVVLTGAVVGADLPGRTVIGNNNFIGYHAVVGVKCQDLKYKDGDDCFLHIGNNNDIREYASIHRSSNSSDKTVIGDNNLFMASCHIAHDCKVGNHNIFANATLVGGHVVVQDHVHIGGAAAVHQFCHVGSFSFVAAGSMVVRDVPMYMMVAGDRAELRGLNLEGLRRRGFSDFEVRSLRRAYQKLFLCSDVNAGGLEDRLAELEQNKELANVPVVILMVQSVRDCFKENRRGICKFRDWTSG